jgi:hypothetical protein
MPATVLPWMEWTQVWIQSNATVQFSSPSVKILTGLSFMEGHLLIFFSVALRELSANIGDIFCFPTLVLTLFDYIKNC